MNKRIFIILFFIFSVFISLSAVCADNITEDASTLSAMDDDLSIAMDNDDALNVNAADSSFKDLNTTINSGNDVVEINEDYTFNDETDEDFVEGIKIVRDNLIINGNNHTIDANNKARFFDIKGHNIVINDLIFKNGNDTAILDYGSLKTCNVVFNNCSSDDGAAIYVADAQYLSENDKFIGNYASESGIIFSNRANVTINTGFFEGNTANKGSAVFAMDSNVTVNGSVLSNNHNNWSSIYLEYSNINVSDTAFFNSTSRYATAIYSENGQTIIKKSRFINLIANITAGALAFKESSDVLIEGCEFVNSVSSRNGGAIFIDIRAETDEYEGDILINNTLFDGCLSEFGGAYLQLGGQLLIANSNFTDNYAEFNGGAIYLSTTEGHIDKCIFSENNVNLTYDGYPTYGGAIFCDDSTIGIYDSEFINNSAVEGSALYLYDSKYDLDNLEFNGNNNAVYALFDEGSKRSNLKGNDNISDDDFGNAIYYDVISGEGMQIVLLNNTINVTSLPARYDLREENLVTPVKDQGNMGACWAFGSIAALESAILKSMNLTTDFSENNMQNSMLHYSKVGHKGSFEGGINLDSVAYLVSWLGAFPNDYDTYDELGKISPYIRTEEDIHIQDVIILSHIPGDEDSIRNVKELIYSYGAIGGYLLSKSSQSDGNPTGYYNENTSAEYVPDHLISNHAICVVGWDDDYSASNFLITPPGDGAWIVKNSWGTDWGEDGYFYVSYYDQSLCAFPEHLEEYFVAFVFENDLQYSNNYQYDISGLRGYYEEESGPVYYLNSFYAYEDDLIAAVGTYFSDGGVEYEVNIYVNDEMVYTQSGISPFPGYHTIKLDKYVSIKQGDEFSASILSNAMPYCINTRMHYQNGSYLSSNGEVWTDLVTQGLVACLKVYTVADDTELIDNKNIAVDYSGGKYFSVKVVTADGHAVAGASVQFSINGKTSTAKTDENGIAKIKITDLPGKYSITTTYNGKTYKNTVTVKQVLTSTKFSVKNTDKKLILKATLKINGKAVKGKTIKVTFKGKTYSAKTNAKGIAAVTIKQNVVKKLTGKSYAVKVAYLKDTIKTTVNVKQVLKASKVTVKKTAKKFTLKATLKINGKAAKGKTIKFKLNGKTYKAKTNAKGIAQKTLNKKVIKKLKKGKTYTVKVTYLKDTIKTTVKVK